MKKFLCTLSGDDWYIINVCSKDDPRVVLPFMMIGLFVLIISVLCFLSSFFTFTQLFQSYWIGVPGGILFALMITNIYIFLLYTLSKTVHHFFQGEQNRTPRYISIFGRLLFVWLIAVLVSKPLEVMIFRGQLDAETQAFKEEQLLRFRSVTEHFFDNEIAQLQYSVDQQLRMSDGTETDEIRKERALIEKRKDDKQVLIAKMESLVLKSNYYVQSIVTLNAKYPLCWLITLLVMAIFTVPAYLKNHIRAGGTFYSRKTDIERGVIRRAYDKFVEKYREIVLSHFGKDIAYVEPFEDPPFNMVRKTDKRVIKSEENLIERLYDADV